MAKGAVVISWGANVPGREATGLQVFGSALEMAQRYAKDGRIDSHKEFFSRARPGGFQLLEGDVTTLHDILEEDEFRTLVIKTQAIVQDLRIELYLGGVDDTTAQAIGMYTNAIGELGYM